MNTMKTLAALAVTAATLAATVGPSSAYGRFFPGHGPVITHGFGPGRITCLACNLPRPEPRPIWGHGYWGHWYRWHPVIVGGGPIGPGAAPMSAPAMAAAGPQAPTGSCNCLTKQNLPNGGVLFQDVCTQQSAIAPPQTMSAR